MTRSARAVVLGVVAALAIAWFWFGSNEMTISSPPETHTSTPDVPLTETTVGVPSVTAVEGNAGAPQASSTATDDERAASEAKKISDAFERGVTSTFVDYLTSKGASREDSQRIVADGNGTRQPSMAGATRNAAPAIGTALCGSETALRRSRRQRRQISRLSAGRRWHESRKRWIVRERRGRSIE